MSRAGVLHESADPGFILDKRAVKSPSFTPKSCLFGEEGVEAVHSCGFGIAVQKQHLNILVASVAIEVMIGTVPAPQSIPAFYFSLSK